MKDVSFLKSISYERFKMTTQPRLSQDVLENLADNPLYLLVEKYNLHKENIKIDRI